MPASSSREPHEEPKGDITLDPGDDSDYMWSHVQASPEWEQVLDAEEQDTMRIVHDLALARQKEREEEEKKKGSRRLLRFRK